MAARGGPRTIVTGWLVQRNNAERVQVSLEWRHPPLKHHPARARHRQQVAVPRRLGRVARHPAVPSVVADELLKVGEQSHARSLIRHRGPRQQLVLAFPGPRYRHSVGPEPEPSGLTIHTEEVWLCLYTAVKEEAYGYERRNQQGGRRGLRNQGGNPVVADHIHCLEIHIGHWIGYPGVGELIECIVGSRRPVA